MRSLVFNVVSYLSFAFASSQLVNPYLPYFSTTFTSSSVFNLVDFETSSDYEGGISLIAIGFLTYV